MQIIQYECWDYRMFCPVREQPGADRRQRLSSSVVVAGLQVSTDRKTFLSSVRLALHDDRFRISIR
jgi:hypothetical protein